MSDEHTPRTEDVRAAYPFGSGILPAYYDAEFQDANQEMLDQFDRWLAGLKREWQAEALIQEADQLAGYTMQLQRLDGRLMVPFEDVLRLIRRDADLLHPLRSVPTEEKP